VTAVLSAGLSGYWVSRWKANTDHAEKRVDDLCEEVISLADLASEYWTLDQTDPKIPVLEARLQAGLMRAALMRNSLANVVRGLHNEKIVNAEAEFVRATTGGDFGVHNRKASPEAAAASQFAGSALLVEIRRARLSAMERSWIPRA
jgi:hypothetical protein